MPYNLPPSLHVASIFEHACVFRNRNTPGRNFQRWNFH